MRLLAGIDTLCDALKLLENDGSFLTKPIDCACYGICVLLDVLVKLLVEDFLRSQNRLTLIQLLLNEVLSKLLLRVLSGSIEGHALQHKLRAVVAMLKLIVITCGHVLHRHRYHLIIRLGVSLHAYYLGPTRTLR